MSNSRRRENIYRAFKIIKMFQNRREVRVRDIADELGMCKQNAQRWINEASRVLPIYELREEPCVLRNNNRAYNKRKVYAILKSS